MNKSELINEVAAHTKGSFTVESVVNATLEAVVDGLVKDKEVKLPSFGTFKLTAKPERRGTNPATGEKMTIAAKNAVSFKPGTGLKDAVN